MSTPRVVELDLFSDVVCPWCFIGKRRLDKAIAAEPEIEFKVRWRAHQLDPQMPAAGVAPGPYFETRIGTPAQRDAAFARVTALGPAEGIAFDFSRVRAPNTVLAHRMIQSAPNDLKLVDDLFSAHFEHGVDLSDLEAVLAFLGPARAWLRESLAEGTGTDAVLADLDWAAQIGVCAVPLYIADKQRAIQGAAEIDEFRAFLRGG